MNRRSFLARSAVIASAAMAAPRLLRADEAGKRLNIAVIGANGKGASDTKGIAYDHNVVALVDVDTKRNEDALKAYLKSLEEKKLEAPKTPPKLFTDFRKMFDTMAKDIDGVIISTPDHTHYAAAVWALRHKKHICVQKPLTNTIWEARELHRLAKDAGVVTQMGNQGRTMDGQRNVKEWIEQGAIGTLKEVRLWTNRPIWPQGKIATRPGTVPTTLDWDIFQGQQEAIPYFEIETTDKDGKQKWDSIHPFKWRGWWDYGSGALGDMGCHIMDCTFNLLGRVVPTKIDVECGETSPQTAPNWTNLKYHMPSSGKYSELTVSWNDGKRDGKANKPEKDPRVPDEPFNKASSGMMLIGTDGVIMDQDSYCRDPQIYPKERFDDVKKEIASGKIKKTEARSPVPGNPQLEWAHCIVKGGAPSSNFDYAVPLTEFVQLGNLAIRSGQSIQWDTAAMRVTNAETANKFVKRASYRKEWI